MKTNIRTDFTPYGFILLDIDSLTIQLNKSNKISKSINKSNLETISFILQKFNDSKINFNILIRNENLFDYFKEKKDVKIFRRIDQNIVNTHSLILSNNKNVIEYFNRLGSYAGLFSSMQMHEHEVYIQTMKPLNFDFAKIRNLQKKLNEENILFEFTEENIPQKEKISFEEFNRKYPVSAHSKHFFEKTNYRFFDLQLFLSDFKEVQIENQRKSVMLQKKAEGQNTDFYKRNTQKSAVKMKGAQKKIIIQNLKEHQKNLKSKRKHFLKSFYAKYQNLPNDEKEAFISSQLSDDLYIKIYLKLLKVEIETEKWIKESRNKNKDDSKILPVYVEALEMYDLIKKYILEVHKLSEENIFDKKEIEERVADMRKKIVFISESLEKSNLIGVKEEINKKFNVLLHELWKKIFKKENFEIEVSELDVYFQIEYCGPYLSRVPRPSMEKDLTTINDHRVVFSPDDWQVRLLDLVDDYGKALICAPTASGKTFIAYYAIERVLVDFFTKKENLNGKVLFVVPTKSLANQVTADIYVRFSNFSVTTKNRQENVKNLQGTLSKDFFLDINSHVLIATPEMLETLEIERFDFVIIDEFHLMNSNPSIERALFRIKNGCLLLSATLSNQKEISSFLNLHEKYEIIETNKRFAELYYYVYDKKKKDAFEIHPYILEEKKFKFMNLTPPDVLTLFYAIYNATKTFKLKESKKKLKEISIKNFFKNNILIREDVERWERELVDFANKMILNQESEEREKIFREIKNYCCLESEEVFKEYFNYENFNKNLNQNLEKLNINNSNKSDSKNKNDSENNNYKNIINLLISLKDKHLSDLLPEIVAEKIGASNFPLKDSLPALTFILDDNSCIAACIYAYYYLLEYNKLTNELIEIFDSFDYASKKTEKKKEEIKKKISKQEKRTRDVKKDKDFWKEETLLRDERAELEKDKLNEYTSFTSPIHRFSDKELEFETYKMKSVFKDDLSEINKLLEYYYAHNDENNAINHQFTDDEALNKRINELINKINSINPCIKLDLRTINFCLVDMLKYGLAIHSEVLSKKYRFLVEKLFRNKGILAVFSTLTLSLGINMPCKTVIFGEDSENLCSSVLKQISGRAGRRGFDVKGNIIFIESNFSKKRIVDLISNKSCEEIRSKNPNETSKIKMLDVCSQRNEDLKSLVYENAMVKPKVGNNAALQKYLKQSVYAFLHNEPISEITYAKFNDFFYFENQEEEESSSDSLFGPEEKDLKLDPIIYADKIMRNKISDLLLAIDDRNTQALVLLFTRNLINFKSTSYEQFCYLIGLIINRNYEVNIENEEYEIISYKEEAKKILGEKIYNFLVDLNSINLNSVNLNSVNSTGEFYNSEKLPFIEFKRNEVYELLVFNTKNIASWHLCNNAIKIFRTFMHILDGEKDFKRMEGMLKKVETRLKEMNS